jgi:hypothetical protein
MLAPGEDCRVSLARHLKRMERNQSRFPSGLLPSLLDLLDSVDLMNVGHEPGLRWLQAVVHRLSTRPKESHFGTGKSRFPICCEDCITLHKFDPSSCKLHTGVLELFELPSTDYILWFRLQSLLPRSSS